MKNGEKQRLLEANRIIRNILVCFKNVSEENTHSAFNIIHGYTIPIAAVEVPTLVNERMNEYGRYFSTFQAKFRVIHPSKSIIVRRKKLDVNYC